jgi:hypothetical protein
MSRQGKLRLLAEDENDVLVISAALQDAITRPLDIDYDRRRRELSVAFSRFVWEGAQQKSPQAQRRRCVLHVANVLGVQSKGLQDLPVDGFVSALALTATPVIADGGELSAQLTLTFAAGYALQVTVEAVEMRLMDADTSWSTSRIPDHDTSKPEPQP